MPIAYSIAYINKKIPCSKHGIFCFSKFKKNAAITANF